VIADYLALTKADHRPVAVTITTMTGRWRLVAGRSRSTRWASAGAAANAINHWDRDIDAFMQRTRGCRRRRGVSRPAARWSSAAAAGSVPCSGWRSTG
jgi:heme O synthase-like polyprenyltransferase